MSKNITLLINKDKNIIACKKRAKQLLSANDNKSLSLTECKSLAAKELGFKDWFDLHNKTKHKYISKQDENQKYAKLLFEELLAEALLNDASDIHMQCNEKTTECAIKLRITGEMYDILNKPALDYQDALSILTHIYKTIKLDSVFEQPYQKISCTINNEMVNSHIQTAKIDEGFQTIIRLYKQNKHEDFSSLQDLGYSNSQIQQLITDLSLTQDSNIIIAGHGGSYKLSSIDINHQPSILDLKDQHNEDAQIIFKSKIIRKEIKDKKDN